MTTSDVGDIVGIRLIVWVIAYVVAWVSEWYLPTSVWVLSFVFAVLLEIGWRLLFKRPMGRRS